MCNNDGAMTAENTTRIILVTLLLSSFVAAQTRPPQTQAPATAEAKAADALELVKQGQKLVSDGQLDKAVAPLTQVMDDSKDTELRQIARLRLARILTDQGKPDEAIKTLAVPMTPAFAARYHEVRGDAYFAKKDIPGALSEYQAALGAADASGINAALLELKIQDLGASLAPVSKAPSPDTLNKAKP